VQPLPGFWRANLTSNIINKCPLGVDQCVLRGTSVGRAMLGTSVARVTRSQDMGMSHR
jgi:hypothetical protein